MYFTQYAIDGGLKDLPSPAAPSSDDIAAFKSRQVLSPAEAGAFPADIGTPYLPNGVDGAEITAWRNSGAVTAITIDDAPLLVNFSHGQDLPGLIEGDLAKHSRVVEAMVGSVLDGLPSKSLWSVAQPGVHMGYNFDTAAATEFVRSGKHMEGLVYRLMAFAVEHALCPFRNRLRAPRATGVYWYVSKMHRDDIVHSVHGHNALEPYMSPHSVGHMSNPLFVVWCDDVRRTSGMSLLARLCDAGGPLAGERAHILSRESAGRVLLAGNCILSRDLPAVEAHSFHTAIREALEILSLYNNVGGDMIQRAFEMVIHNLTILDLGLMREKYPMPWHPSTQRARFGVVHDAQRAEDLMDRVDANLGTSVLDALSFGDPEVRVQRAVDLFSNHDRRAMYHPVRGVGYAPATLHIVSRSIAPYLAAVGGNAQQIRGHNWYCVSWNDEQPVEVPAMARLPKVGDIVGDGIAGVWSGRNYMRMFALYPPLDGAPVPRGLAAIRGDVPDDLTQLAANAGVQGEWYEWTFPNEAQNPAQLPIGAVLVSVRQVVPVNEENYPPTYVAPAGVMNKFKEASNVQFGIRGGGQACPESWHVMTTRFLMTENHSENPIKWLKYDDNPRLAVPHNYAQHTVLLMHAIGVLWDASHAAREQNDAWGRYQRTIAQDDVLTSMPATALLFLGHVRVQQEVHSAGGLWTLCYLRKKTGDDFVNLSDKHTQIMEVLQSPEHMAHHILRTRANVELAALVFRLANASIQNCAYPLPLDGAFNARLSRLGEPSICAIPAQTALQQILVYTLGVVGGSHGFHLVHESVLARGGLRARELAPQPRHDDLDMAIRCNWVIPQTLPSSVISFLTGTAQPTLFLGHAGRQAVRHIRWADGWRDVLEKYMGESLFTDRQDELWAALVANTSKSAYKLATIFLKQYGHTYEVSVLGATSRYDANLVDFMLRLCPPVEFGFKSWLFRERYGARGLLRPTLRTHPLARVDGEHELSADIAYVHGRLHITNPIDPQYGNRAAFRLDRYDTEFCTNGVQQLSSDRQYAFNAGHSWRTVGPITTIDVSTRIGESAKALSPAAVAQLAALKPVTLFGAAKTDGSTSDVGRTPDVVAPTVKNVPGAINNAQSPLVEQADAASVSASITKMLSEMSQDKAVASLTELVLKGKGPTDAGSIVSGLTAVTANETTSTS
jgi:hypothetical protein